MFFMKTSPMSAVWNSDILGVSETDSKFRKKSPFYVDDFDVLLDLARPGLVVRHELRGAVRLRIVRVGSDVLVGPQVDLQVALSIRQRSRLRRL